MSFSLCGNSVANTGQLSCDVSRGVLSKIFIFNGAIGSADYASADAFFTKLVSNSKLAKTAANKVFPIEAAQDIQDTSEANTEGTLGLGFKATLREGKPSYTVKIFAGADLLKRLRKFNNQTVRIVEYDSNGVYWGTKQGTNFVGFQAKLFFSGNHMATGQNVEEGVVTFTISILDVNEYTDNPYYVKPSGNVGDIVSLLDANLVYASNSSNVYKYKVKIPGSNLVEDYDPWDEIGAALAALTFTATGDGSALTVTSVAADNTLKALTVTYDNTAYSGLATGKKIVLVPPSVATLDAGDVTGLEILPSEPFAKPA